jgi:hypothetical protein
MLCEVCPNETLSRFLDAHERAFATTPRCVAMS